MEKIVDSVDNLEPEHTFCAGCPSYHNYGFMSAANGVEYCRDVVGKLIFYEQSAENLNKSGLGVTMYKIDLNIGHTTKM
ncbi:MAG: hypothetical protein PHV18_16190 [Lachnospiraceae bacterium]|nr:hypothetical protein [Lachnospiraceae bacterium]